MSIETANAARYEKGMMKLSPLEGELLEALERAVVDIIETGTIDVDGINHAIDVAHGTYIRGCGESWENEPL